MPFPFRRQRLQATGPRRESTERDLPQPPLYRSPTFRALVSRLGPDAAHNILDLQPAVGANVEFFSRYSCRLQIVDLLTAIGSPGLQVQLESEPGAVFRKVLPRPDEPYDVVLAWEAFNYLAQGQFRALVEHLGGVCRAGALMLAFIATKRDIPLSPPLFRIVDEQTLEWQERASAARPCPRFPPALVERMTEGFVVVHSVLMRQGVQEYLFERIAEPASPRQGRRP
ncbi:MAG TPA: hypothetical protein VMT19_10765 [Thermoanaerobaculaceae bacterium]|nr:hypothetical protein [Thermoanaerobaculaceae bacterium]